MELFIQLIDRCIQLLAARASADRRLFEEHVAPIQEGCREILEDYKGSLMSVKDRWYEDRTAAISELVERRRRMARVRVEP